YWQAKPSKLLQVYKNFKKISQKLLTISRGYNAFNDKITKRFHRELGFLMKKENVLTLGACGVVPALWISLE
ncbi:MAG: hypothetical protein IKC43_03290, partial [Clostridia bacterium]|nr:hypothetical protein [Clostridia bacterium]